MKDARHEAVFILDTMNAIRDYVSTVQRPLIEELKEKKMLSSDFFDPRLLSASYITREIYNIQVAKKNINYDYKLVAIDPLNPDHEGNEFENGILQEFRKGKFKEYSSIIDENNKKYFFVSLPISSSDPSCAQCHTNKDAPREMIDKYHQIPTFNNKGGDILAMLSLKIPIFSILKYHVEQFIVGGFAMLVVFIIFIILIYKIYKKDLHLKEKNETLLVHQNRLATMGEMIGNISHQWKQPLAQIASILINIEFHSDRDKLTKNKLTNKIEEVNEQINFMSSTIDDFKNFFLTNNTKKEFTAHEVINQSKKLLSASLEQHGIHTVIDIQNNFTCKGYSNEIEQVLINIINNAKEAFLIDNIKERLIKIIAYTENNKSIITIESNTRCIDNSIINKIFDPYVTTKESSSGIGLYMSKMIIEKYHGTIDVKNLDYGVIFSIKF